MRKCKCKCGCGEIVKSETANYIRGHARKGKKNSKEHRRKIGEANKGKKRSKKLKAKLSVLKKAFYNTARGKKTKDKLATISTGNSYAMGAIWTIEARLERSKSKGGSGSFIVFHPYVSERRLGKIKNAVILRDHITCANCGKECKLKLSRQSPQTFDVHHVVPAEIGYESELCDHESNLVVLCSKCHHHFEPNGRSGNVVSRWREFLPDAHAYLSSFGYTHLLLNDYYKSEK